MNSEAGQALAEFGLGVTLLTLVIAGGAWLFRAEWRRDQCAYWTFETAHLRLRGEIAKPFPAPIAITESPDEVRAVGRCGDAVESIRLKRLGSIPW